MDFKELFNKFLSKIKHWWKVGTFQKGSRVTYDVVWNVVLFFMIIGIVGLFFAGGVGAGYFASLVDGEEVRSRSDMERDIYNYEETSEILFANNIFLGEVNSDLYREEIKLNEVSEYVTDAIIATEDEYFRTHNGVVPKAIFRAVFQEATNAAVKTGGSTLTQQLIKNQILTNEVSFERKAKEILLALRLERFFDKDEILEAYLNIVPFGRNSNGQNIAGIQTAAQGIFGVDAKDINLAQAAYIAGLPQSPSSYTPFRNGGQLKSEEGLEPGMNRMKTVLNRMLSGGYIKQAEYDEAMSYDIVADFTEPKVSSIEKYPFLTNQVKERATAIIADILAKEDGYTEEDLENNETLQEEYNILADRQIGQNGYKIHTTIDKEIYDVLQKIVKEFDNYGPELPVKDEETGEYVMVENPETGEEEILTEPVQTGVVLKENKTGKIIGFVGGRDFEEYGEVNHITSPRQNGSTMKPLLVYGPAMDAGEVQPGTMIADTKFTYNGPLASGPWTPQNFSRRHFGLTSARSALYNSRNVPAAKTYLEILTTDPKYNPASQYLEKMGVESLLPADHTNPSAALGTPTVTVEDNTNMFATVANGGKFIDGYMIEEIETIDGEKIYQHETDEVEVYSPQTSYLLIDMMRDVLTRGTGTTARANLTHKNVDWAGKTGTTNNSYDSWFMGVNPNVTLGVWLGYDHNKELPDYASTTRLTLWAQLVNATTEVNPDLMAPNHRFERPGGIVSRNYCVTSGMVPSDLCRELGLVETDIFNANYVPTETDDSLIRGRYVTVDGKAYVAGDNTPEEFIQEDGVAFNPEWIKRNGYDQLDDINELFPNREGVWADIAIPNTNEIENDGNAPTTPKSLEKSGDTLVWEPSSSNDLVGYRVYQAADPEASFNLIGNTTNNEFNVPDSKAVYQVTAVDYFGQESDASNTIEVGDFSEEPEEDDNEEEEEPGNSDNPKPPEKPEEPGKPEDPGDLLPENEKTEDETDEE